jgi:hypothetical protein
VTLKIMTKKNAELPGIEGVGVAPVSIEEIDQLVDAYVLRRDARMERTRQEVEAKQKLITALHANVDKIGKDNTGAIIYRHQDLIVTLRAGKEELKVRTSEEEPEE